MALLDNRTWRWFALSMLVAAACTSPQDRAADYTKRAQALLNAGDYAKARLEAQNAIQIAPKNARARWILAQVAEKNGEIGQMLGHMEIVIAEDPKNVAARVKLGTVLVFGQDFAGAKMLSDAALKLAPDDPDARMLRARLEIQKGERDAGIKDLEFVLEKQPKNVEAALLLGVTYGVTDIDRGLKDLAASAKRLSPDEGKPLRDARVRLLSGAGRNAELEQELKQLLVDYPLSGYSAVLAEFYASQNRLDDAEKALRDAVAADPENMNLKLSLAQFQSRTRGKPALAEETLKGFIKESPDKLEFQVLLGTFYEGANRTEEAMAQYSPVVARAPKSQAGLSARYRIAAIKLRSGDTAAARDLYDAILRDAPDDVTALTARGEMNYASGRFNDAVSDLRGALRKAPDQELALLLLARTHRAMRENALAEDAYRHLLEVYPKDRDAPAELANMLTLSGQQDEALALYKQAIATDPKNFRARSGYVDLLLDRDDLEAAEAEAKALYALNDPQGAGGIQLGRVLNIRKQFAPARQAFEKALAKNPLSEAALQGLVTAMMGAGQLAQVADYLRDYVKKHPDMVGAQIMLGGNLARQGKTDDARKVLNDVLRARPGEPRAYTTLAATYPEPAERIRVLQTGIQAVPGDRQLGVLLGTEYELAGRFDDAIKLYEGLLKVDPGRNSIANSLASVLLDHRTDRASYQRALELVQKFAGGSSGAFLDTLGWAHYRLGDYDKAINFLEFAATTGNQPPIVRYHLGMAYLATKNTVGAKAEFRKAVELAKGAPFPGVRESREALSTLENLDNLAKSGGG